MGHAEQHFLSMLFVGWIELYKIIFVYFMNLLAFSRIGQNPVSVLVAQCRLDARPFPATVASANRSSRVAEGFLNPPKHP
jgi:hypothetical protein